MWAHFPLSVDQVNSVAQECAIDDFCCLGLASVNHRGTVGPTRLPKLEVDRTKDYRIMP